MVGAHDMGLYTTPFDVTRLRGRIGPEVESVDLLQLRQAEDDLDPGAVEAEAARLSASWDEPFGPIPPDVLRRCVRLALATLRICGERGFDAFSYKSVEGVSLLLDTTHNLASSLVASAGVPYIDENDMLNLTAQLMLRSLAGATPSFLEHYEHHPDWILLGVDGFVPDDWVEGRPRVKPVSSVATGAPVGVAQCSRMRPGRLTLACLAEADTADGYRMHVVTGEGVAPPIVGGDERPGAAAEPPLHPRRRRPVDPRPRAVPALRGRARRPCGWPPAALHAPGHPGRRRPL